MTPKQLMQAAMVLAAVVFLWGISEILKSRGDEVERAPVFGPLVEEQVDRVEFLAGGDTTTLIRTPSGDWQVNGYGADPDRVRDFFGAVSEEIEGDLAARSASSHGRMEVDSATGKRLTVYQGEQAVAELVVGKRGRAFRSVYVRRPGSDTVYLVEGQLGEVVRRTVKDWRDKRISEVDAADINAAVVTRDGESYTIMRADSGWVFQDGSPADKEQVDRYAGRFAPVLAQGGFFATDAQQDSIDFGNATRRLTLLDESGDTLAFLVMVEQDNKFWVRGAAASSVYQLMSWKANEITPLRTALEPEKPEASEGS